MSGKTQESIPLSEVNSQLFDDNDKRDFTLVSGEVSMPVTLMVCEEKPDSAGPDSFRTPFTLLFQADLDEAHPMQRALEFHGAIEGLEKGAIEGLLIHRTLRPVRMPEGAYYQVMFN